MDWISDGIARIRNAIMARKSDVIIRGTKVMLEILEIMKQEGFIRGYALLPKDDDSSALKQSCVVQLVYRDSKPVIRAIKRISKPSLRIYVPSNSLKTYLKRYSVPIVSTSHGVVSGKYAIANNLGGELLCEVM